MGIRDKEWVIRTGEGFIIPHDRIRIGPWGNVRTDITTETVAIRANSLVLKGQESPVSGLLSEDGEWFELIDGELRWKAWEYAKTFLGVDLDEKYRGMRCRLEPDFVRSRPSKKDVIKLQLSYGTDSVPLSYYDKARNVKKLIDSGESVSDLAKLMHCSEQTIRNMISTSEVPEDVQKNLKPTTALKYSRADKAEKKRIEKKINSGEKVKGKDIKKKPEEPPEAIQETTEGDFSTASDELMNGLTAYEIKKQIQKAEVKAAKTGDRYFSGMVTGFKIVLGKEPKI